MCWECGSCAAGPCRERSADKGRRGRCRIPTSRLIIRAPAIGVADAFIEAPIETVWGILSDLENWPTWNKSVSKIRVDGPIAAGTSFFWVGNGSKIVSRLEEVDPPRRIAWTGKLFGIRATHVWELEEKGQGTQVHTEESFEGLGREALPRLRQENTGQGPGSGRRGLEGRSGVTDSPLNRGHNTNFRISPSLEIANKTS